MNRDISQLIVNNAIQIEDAFWNKFDNQSLSLPDTDDGSKIEILTVEVAIVSLALTFLSRFNKENRQIMMDNLFNNIMANELLLDP